LPHVPIELAAGLLGVTREGAAIAAAVFDRWLAPPPRLAAAL